MERKTIENFLKRWDRYFPNTDLPFALFYSDDDRYFDDLRPQETFGCMIAHFGPVQKGKRVAFASETISCQGGVKYSGFPVKPNPGLKYFLSCGEQDKYEGLRLKKTPKLVVQAEGTMPLPSATGKYLVATRIDKLEDDEEPEVISWFATADVLSALVGLAAFHQADRLCVISPQASGCGSIISYPGAEKENDDPKAILGMFDISARPYVPKNTLSFAVPVNLFETMVSNMDMSFLATPSWEKVMKRL